MPYGAVAAVGVEYSEIRPEVVILATLLRLYSVNHRLPSGPGAIINGPLLAVGVGYSVTPPVVVTLATLFANTSVIQRLPSGPAAIP